MELQKKRLFLEEIIQRNQYIHKKSSVYHKTKITKESNYADNFGVQWNYFAKTQFDSHTKLSLTEDRLFKCSEWNRDDLQGKLILEMGSGAGRFTEIFLKYGALVVSVEMSSAAYANAKNNSNKNLFVIKDSILEFKLHGIYFDYVFCYGVAQHLPNPNDAYHICASFLKPSEGLITIDHYWKRLGKIIPCFLYYPKYLWRPVSTKLNPIFLLKILKIYCSIFLPIDIFLKKIFGGRIYKFIKLFLPYPIANYYKVKGVNQDYSTLLEWSIMDTFDQLGAKYDSPWTLGYLKKISKNLPLKNIKLKIVSDNGNGLILNAKAM